MRQLRIFVIISLLILMALPAIADRRKIKKGIGPMLSSGRIALRSDPPRYDEAMAYFDTVLTDYGPMPEAYYYRSVIYAEFASQVYDFESKIENFTKMTANRDSMILACGSNDVKKKYRDDCKDYSNVIDSIKAGFWRTNYNEGIKIIGRVDKELKPNISNATDSASLELANVELAAAADSGKGFFRIAKAVDPLDYRSMEGLGILYDRLKNNDSAIFWFNQAYELAPDSINIVQSLAYSYIQKKDWKNSIVFFQKSLEINPDDMNTVLNVAVCFNNLQQFDSVFYYDQLAIKVNPDEPSPWYDIGQIWLWRSQTYSDSTKFYKMKEKPEEASKFQSLQTMSLDSSSYYYCQSSELDTTDQVALEQCAVVTMIRGEYEGAAEKFSRLTEMSPDVFDYWVNLGDCLIQLRKFKEAIGPYEKATEIDPKDKKLWEVLSSLYESEKMTEKANMAIDKIKELEG